MKATKKNKKLLIITIIALVLIVAAVAVVVVTQQNNKCDAITCAYGDKCIAPNDGLVSCEELRKNPGKTDWGPGIN